MDKNGQTGMIKGMPDLPAIMKGNNYVPDIGKLEIYLHFILIF